MRYNEAIRRCDEMLLPAAVKKYHLEGYAILPLAGHDGGRNLIYVCEKAGAEARILRIAYLEDRGQEEFLAELAYVRFLYDNGASVANVICSANGNLVEEIADQGHSFFLSLFEKAKGKMLAENQYRYRDGVPVTEYFYNCGKTLGKIHQLSKRYQPVYCRHSFFDQFSKRYVDGLLPVGMDTLKEKISAILAALEKVDRTSDTFGMIHFDYHDGNYHIDFDTGKITVYDFDNSCMGWYMLDLASLWTQGIGWIRFEEDGEKRKKFMDAYFATVLEGYRTETKLEDTQLQLLPLFIQATVIEHILDIFESRKNGDEDPDDTALAYLEKCLIDDIPYMGFFHEIYFPDAFI